MMGAVFKVGVVVLVAVASLCLCVSLASAHEPMGEDFDVVVGETYIYVDYPTDPPYIIYFDGVLVSLPGYSLIVFGDLDPGSRHEVHMVLGDPAVGYSMNTYTLPSLDYLPLIFLFLVFLICLYLSTRLWVFLALSAMLSLVIMSFVRDVGYLWVFEVLGALCFVCTVVAGALMLTRTRK